ncbi:MAG: PD-(D/E)XK nuclease family protein [Brevinematia bacterium]
MGNLFDVDPKIYVSKTDFVNILMCPYTFLLKNKVKIHPTENVVQGTNLHKIMKRINQINDIERVKKFIEVKMKERSYMKKELANIIYFLNCRLEDNLDIFPKYQELKVKMDVGKYVFNGIIDAVYCYKDGFEVFEYKKSFYKQHDDIFLETLFYSFVLEDFSKTSVRRMGIFSFSTGKVYYKDYNQKDFIPKIDVVINTLERNDFSPRNSYENCRICIYRNMCDFSSFR